MYHIKYSCVLTTTYIILLILNKHNGDDSPQSYGLLKIHISQSGNIKFQKGAQISPKHSCGLWVCLLFGVSNVILKTDTR
jgi:hypothetical protein